MTPIPFPAISRWRPWLILTLIIVIHGIVNVVWVQQDQTLRSLDMPPHLEAQLHVYCVIKNHGLQGVARVLSRPEFSLWPTAQYFPGAIFALVFGHSISTLRFFTFLYMVVLLLCVYRIGTLARSRSVGLLAAALVSLYPVVYGESRQFSADFPGMVVTTFNVMMLLNTRRYSRTWGSLLFGVCIGLGIYIRPHSLFFLTWPAVALAIAAMARPTTSRWRVLLNVGLALAASAAASARWWLGRINNILETFLPHYGGQVAPYRHGPSHEFYLKVLPICFSWLLAVTALLAIVTLLWAWYRTLRAGSSSPETAGPPDPSDSLRWDGQLVTWAWFLGGSVALLNIGVSHLRYLLPLSPALALLTAAGLLKITHRPLRRLVIGLALGMAAVTWVADSFGLTHWELDRVLFAEGLPAEVDVASGPPRVDPIVVMADRVSSLIAARHRSGEGIFVRLVQENAHGWTAHRAAVGPFVGSRLPGALVTAEDYHQQMRDLRRTMDIGAANVPLTCVKFRHLYLILVKARGGRQERPLPGSKKLFDGPIVDPSTGEVIERRVELWYWPIPPGSRKSPCP